MSVGKKGAKQRCDTNEAGALARPLSVIKYGVSIREREKERESMHTVVSLLVLIVLRGVGLDGPVGGHT